jgi:hypothetical protein
MSARPDERDVQHEVRDERVPHHRHHGRAVQVDPIKPKLKPPGTKRLKLQYDEPLSKYAFKFNLRRYTMDGANVEIAEEIGEVGRCGLTLSNSRSKHLELSS